MKPAQPRYHREKLPLAERIALPSWDSDTFAEFMGIHPITAVIWRRQGKGPPFVQPAPGDASIIRYLREDVFDWLEANRTNVLPETLTAARPSEARRVGAR